MPAARSIADARQTDQALPRSLSSLTASIRSVDPAGYAQKLFCPNRRRYRRLSL